MPKVASSAIREVEHDGRERLTVTFVTGRRYVYSGVSREHYEALLGAASKGAFFNERIRDAFPSEEIRRIRPLSR